MKLGNINIITGVDKETVSKELRTRIRDQFGQYSTDSNSDLPILFVSDAETILKLKKELFEVTSSITPEEIQFKLPEDFTLDYIFDIDDCGRVFVKFREVFVENPVDPIERFITLSQRGSVYFIIGRYVDKSIPKDLRGE